MSPAGEPDTAAGLSAFHPATREWFGSSFDQPTAAQDLAWRALQTGEHALVVAPTGSGKTLAAFLAAIDRLTDPTAEPDDPLRRCRVLYISPLKALAIDVERNLRAPMVGIEQAAGRLGEPFRPLVVSTRTADTSQADRRAFNRRPGDILITTPESLFLLLTSAARESLRGIDTVIIDEIHALAGTKRGAHLALSLERLDRNLARPAQRIGLSATVNPVDDVAAFLAGPRERDIVVVQPPAAKTLDLSVVVPVEDLSDLSDQQDADGHARRSIWPAVEERIYDLVRAHHSTIVFANSRRSAERLTSRLNELANPSALEGTAFPAEMISQGSTGAAPDDEVVARAHHGSVSREQRLIAEEGFKSGVLPAVVATSSLELGIDMGAVDLVVQVESTPSVSSGLQRVGRAGHHVGAPSKGIFFPKHRGDLVATTVVVSRMYSGELEPIVVPRNPLDVLAQQIVAILAEGPSTVADLFALVRRAHSFQKLGEPVFRGVLDMLAGRYPSDRFAGLRPRIVWDRHTDELTARPGAARLAITSGGTIPDRGLFGVYLAGAENERGGRRVGELDEEMVYESRVGDVFLLGTSTWRIVEITHDRVLVVPAPGVPGRMPFWTGEQQGRPLPLGRAIGAFLRALEAGEPTPELANLDDFARSNLTDYVAAQRTATGVVPHDRRIVVERFRDELGDWRVIVHSPFGDQVNGPWSLLIGARLAAEFGTEAQAMHADDGIVLRVPDTTGEPPSADLIDFDPEDVERLVTDQLTNSALFAARFRECAGRALLLPRRDPSKRSPLWQQRQRAAQLLSVAADFDDFPIILETIRECLQDVYDVPGLIDVLRQIRNRTISVSEVETPVASPFAQSLLFGYISAFIYQQDVPLAERRASALSLDMGLLRELLGQLQFRELLDLDVIEEVEREIGWRTSDRSIGDAERLADALRVLGPLTLDDLSQRGGTVASADDLLAQRRAIVVRIAGEQFYAAIEDAGRLQGALGTALPVGVPTAFTDPVPDPLGDIIGRFARTHGPFTVDDVSRRFGLGPAVVRRELDLLTDAGRLTAGEFRPGGHAPEWCDNDVLSRIRRRSLAKSRAEIEPVTGQQFARFLPRWQQVGTGALRGIDGTYNAVEQLSGAAIAASAWETLVLPSRINGYSPGFLDELMIAGDLTWVGAGATAGSDGFIRLLTADAALTLPAPAVVTDPLESAIVEALRGGQALYFRALVDAVRASGHDVAEGDFIDALWRLAWSGHVTNDSFAPVRARLHGQKRARASSRRGRLSRARVAAPNPPAVSGRWSLIAYSAEPDTEAAALRADLLVDRYGVLTRGSVQAEDVDGGFAGLYPYLAAYEDAGRLRRGYFIEGLGAAQFASAAAIDRLRSESGEPSTVVLAAADPAQPFGAALPWPDGIGLDGSVSTHRPGRKAGALAILHDGLPVLYVERGGKTVLRFTEDETALRAAATALAATVQTGAIGTLHVQRADGTDVDLHGPVAQALAEAGFRLTPRGLRLRG